MTAAPSRRAVLAAAASSAILVAAAGQAGAQQKISKTDAKYQDHPKGQQRCEICVNFAPPDQCRFVVGPISKTGWCELFAAKENAH